MSETALPAADRGERLYARIVRVLQHEIAAGRYPVGSRLPTEKDLCARFGASRNSVREALRQLRGAGLVSARQGSGTIVERMQPAGEFIHSVPSIDEIMSWASESRFRTDRCAVVRADARLAQRLDCSPGRRWLHIEGYRFATGFEEVPLCWAEAYLHHAYASIREQIGRQPGPVYGLIEQVYGERIVEVRETIRATTLSPELAAALNAAAGAPALVVDRVYRAANDRVVEIAHSIHPADRFSYAITLRRDREPSAVQAGPIARFGVVATR